MNLINLNSVGDSLIIVEGGKSVFVKQLAAAGLKTPPILGFLFFFPCEFIPLLEHDCDINAIASFDSANTYLIATTSRAGNTVCYSLYVYDRQKKSLQEKYKFAKPILDIKANLRTILLVFQTCILVLGSNFTIAYRINLRLFLPFFYSLMHIQPFLSIIPKLLELELQQSPWALIVPGLHPLTNSYLLVNWTKLQYQLVPIVAELSLSISLRKLFHFFANTQHLCTWARPNHLKKDSLCHRECWKVKRSMNRWSLSPSHC